MNGKEEFRNKIDDYEQTIQAIVGFMNFFRYDPVRKEIRRDVIVFQGRKFIPSPQKSLNREGEKINYVTPDIGILLPSKNGVIGEVKKSFPSKKERWLKIFEQLMKYDDDLTGWPTSDEKVNSHDIVLILHISRAVAVNEFYDTHKGTEIEIKRPFSIVEFSRSNEGKQFYFFRKVSGGLSEEAIDNQLKYGVQVPMDVFINLYSTIKLYDDEPPLPYFLQLIWENVVLFKAAESGRLERLRKNQKIDIDLEIETIIEELHRGFSFRGLYDNESERQPKIPRREWVYRACYKLVELKEAKWSDEDKTTIIVFFRLYDDVLAHFTECCSGEEEDDKQMKLFKNEEPE